MTTTETTTIKKKIPTVAKVQEMIYETITEATNETSTTKKVPTVDKVQEMIDENNNIPTYYIIDKLTPSATFFYGKIYYDYQEEEQSAYNIQETSILFNTLCEEYEKSLEVQIKAGDKVIYSCNLNPVWSLSLRENYYHSYSNILDLSSIRLTGITKDAELKLWIQQESTFYEITTLPIKKHNEIIGDLSISGNVIHNSTNLFDDSNKINTNLLKLNNIFCRFNEIGKTGTFFKSFTVNNTTYQSNYEVRDYHTISITLYQNNDTKEVIAIWSEYPNENYHIDYKLDNENWTKITDSSNNYVYKNTTTIDINTLDIPDKFKFRALNIAYCYKLQFYNMAYLTYSYNTDSILTVAALRDILYPIGAIYVSTYMYSPEAFIGGTWEQIIDRFLYCANIPNVTGGSKTISVDNLPSHSHQAPIGFGAGSNGEGYARCDQNSPASLWGPTTAVGGGKDYMPPYYTVRAWKRIA